MKRFNYILSIICVFILAACSKNTPTEETIKKDIETTYSKAILNKQIEYAGSNTVYDKWSVLNQIVSYQTTLESIKIDKTQTSDQENKLWCEILSSNNNFSCKSYYIFNYQKGEKNNWELESIEKYEDDSYDFAKGIDLDYLMSVFPYDDPEIIDQSIQENNIHNIKIKSHNPEGYISAVTGTILYEPVELILDLEFIFTNGRWLLNNRSTTGVSADAIDKAQIQIMLAEDYQSQLDESASIELSLNEDYQNSNELIYNINVIYPDHTDTGLIKAIYETRTEFIYTGYEELTAPGQAAP